METFEKTLRQLVSIPSVFPHEQVLADCVYSYLIQITPHVEKIPAEKGRDMVVATIGEATEYICFYGHMDTVSPDPLWKHDPFEVRKQGDILTGLGVADMKGGIAAILETARYAAAHMLSMKVAFGVDEENISLGSHILVQSPFFKDVSAIISAESGQIFDETQDFAVNYGRKGRCVMRIEIVGKKAHAARSDAARNAIEDASKLIPAIDSIVFPSHPHLGSVEIIPYSIHSETDSFSIPDSSTIAFNVLTVPGVTSEKVICAVKDLMKKHDISGTVSIPERETPYMEAYEVDRSSSFVKSLEEEILLHFQTKPGYAKSVADENRFAHVLQIPVISLGPVGGGDHTASEWVSLRSLSKTVGVYCEILKSLL